MDKRRLSQGEAVAREAARAWLPTLDGLAEAAIADVLEAVAASGADPVAELRSAVATWFGDGASAALPGPAAPVEDGTADLLTLEALAPIPRPRLWPQRPKRRAGELFSSWLWRAALAAGVPPRRFVRDVVGNSHDDIDRDLAPDTLRRLAAWSGQPARHLGAGLLASGDLASTPAEAAELILPRDDRFVLSRQGYDRRGRRRPVPRYCAQCLGQPDGPYFRRAWWLAPFAVPSRMAAGCTMEAGGAARRLRR